MSKRGAEPTRSGNSKVKKRKNVKIRSTLIPDSDEEPPPLNVDTQYMRWVKTRVTASGDGKVTTSKVPFSEMMSGIEDDPLLLPEVDTNDMTLEDTGRTTTATQRRRRKVNDSVSYSLALFLLSY